MIKYIKKLITFFHHLFTQKISSEKLIFSLKIDIDKIKYFLELKNTLDRRDFIWDGNWDQKKIDILSYRNYSDSYNSIFQIYNEKIDYEQCDEYKKKAKLLLEGKKTARAHNIDELKNYFKSLDNLKDNLKKFGYKSQLELENNTRVNDEIGVVIDRDGKIIKLEDKFGGTHRFALCKVLKIKTIIVSVKAIHKSLLNEIDLKEVTTSKNKFITKTLLVKKIKY
jgi:hypothetical protein